MRILILGGGVAGICSAYYLARAGHEVNLLERQSGPALETSYANAGQISPAYSAPWAAPGIPFKALKWLLQRHAPLAIRPDGSLFQLRWLYQMLRNCNASRYVLNKERMVRLAEYSRDCLRVLRAETGIAYEGRQRGTLQVFRDQGQLRAAQRDIRVLLESGVPFELLTPERLWEAEPALDAVRHKLSGGLWLPNDETGDCYLFTRQLARLAQKNGARLRFGAGIEGLEWRDGAPAGVRCGGELLSADAYVVALGVWSRGLLLPRLDLPVYPVKGYSITLPLAQEEGAPLSTVIDETYKIAITRFERRLRVGGMAELTGFDMRLDPRRRATLQMVCDDLFPHGASKAQASFWTGLRPMTPDGTPLVGATPWPNLFLNTGHGTLGWTMACGSGQLLADLVDGRNPAIPAQDLSLARYRRQGEDARAQPA